MKKLLAADQIDNSSFNRCHHTIHLGTRPGILSRDVPLATQRLAIVGEGREGLRTHVRGRGVALGDLLALDLEAFRRELAPDRLRYHHLAALFCPGPQK